MSVACTKEQGIGIIALSGPLTAATVEAFREQLAAWQAGEADIKNFVFDLSSVDFMDSAGLGSLIAALKRITERGGDMKLACLQKKPRMVFEITRAYKVFEIFDTLEEAIQAARK
jgi:anti-sigma B factor antagonist